MNKEQANEWFIRLNKAYNNIKLDDELDYSDYKVFTSEYKEKYKDIEYYISVIPVNENYNTFKIDMKYDGNIYLRTSLCVELDFYDNKYIMDVIFNRDLLFLETKYGHDVITIINSFIIINKNKVK